MYIINECNGTAAYIPQLYKCYFTPEGTGASSQEECYFYYYA